MQGMGREGSRPFFFFGRVQVSFSLKKNVLGGVQLGPDTILITH